MYEGQMYDVRFMYKGQMYDVRFNCDFLKIRCKITKIFAHVKKKLYFCTLFREKCIRTRKELTCLTL